MDVGLCVDDLAYNEIKVVLNKYYKCIFEDELYPNSLFQSSTKLYTKAVLHFLLLAYRPKHDVLVVDTITKLGRSINELMNCTKRLGIPIYSLKEGLVYVVGKENKV